MTQMKMRCNRKNQLSLMIPIWLNYMHKYMIILKWSVLTLENCTNESSKTRVIKVIGGQSR